MSLIVDASVAVKWFVAEDLRAEARELIRSTEEFEAPDFILAEVSNVLWRKILKGEIENAQAREISQQLPDLFSHLYPTELLHGRALEIAICLRHPVYDCLYLACVEEAGEGRVVTADRRFHAATEGTTHAGRVVHLTELAA